MTKKAIAVIVVLLNITSCASTQSGDEQTARGQATAMGAIACAIVAGGAAYAVSGKAVYTAAAATMAGILCGLAAFSYADRMVKYRRELVGKEQSLEKQIELAQAANVMAKKRNAKLETEKIDLESQIDLLARGIHRGDVKQVQLVQYKNALEEQIARAQLDVKEAQKDLDDRIAFRDSSGAVSGELDQEIEALTVALDRLRRNTTELAAMRQTLP